MAIQAARKSKGHKAPAFLVGSDDTRDWSASSPPKRFHTIHYHRPRLLDERAVCERFLAWFDSTSEKRQMPWRKAWLSSTDFQGTEKDFRTAQAKRAYEVWVSEIMLQQTHVSVVIPYFNNWIAKWPTVEDLATASQDEVLAAWKGMGYYSRATRLHEAAQQIVKDMDGAISADADNLLKIKGIGRYTAGAVSSIAFGRAVPLLDGNVGRVLCRQLGIHARAKEKKIEDILWDAADVLVKYAAQHDDQTSTSDVPSRWNQGLMELGSTVCTPKPKCQECPIQFTCRTYAEGQVLSRANKKELSSTDTVDIEDACHLCETLELEEVENAAEEVLLEQNASNKSERKGRKRAGSSTVLATHLAKATKASQGKQRSLRDFSSFASVPAAKAQSPATVAVQDDAARVVGYCSLFPKREQKKSVPEEECIVCIIRRDTSAGAKYLIEQRPPKGLLALLWQFPTYTVPATTESKVKERKAKSLTFVQGLLGNDADIKLNVSSEKGTIIHVFSHLKLQMHIHAFTLQCQDNVVMGLASKELPKRVWVDKEGADAATLGTGMRRCWERYINGIGVVAYDTN